jgi:hypothetical protein
MTEVEARNIERFQALGNLDWPNNWTPLGGREYVEVIRHEDRTVWMCQQSMSREAFDAIEVPEGWSKLGIGSGLHDVAFFRRSPGKPFDGPLDVVEIDGWTFAQVARPGKPEPGFERVTVLPVYKYHRVGFVAGRTISILDMGDGWDYVPQVSAASFRPDADSGNAPEMPEGWSIRDVVLDEDLLVEMPYPARVCFFDTGDSWQGPVRLDLPR